MSTSDDLCSAIGEEAFDRICVAYGGMRLYFSPHMEERLAMVIGETLAKKVCQLFDGERLEIPKESKFRRQRKAAELQQRLIKQQEAGLSETEIAVSNGLSVRHVRTILNRPES